MQQQYSIYSHLVKPV